MNFQKHSIKNSFFLCDKILYSYSFHNTYVVKMYICNISIIIFTGEEYMHTCKQIHPVREGDFCFVFLSILHDFEKYLRVKT